METTPSSLPPYMTGLNPVQLEAVEATDGPVLVLAGAGTGKTRVLTTRLAHILMQGKTSTHNMLAVTFTNKAAREMRERLEKMLGQAVEGMWLGTFHNLCVRIVRRNPEVVGLTSNFTILDSDDQIRLVKQVLELHNIDPKRWPAKMILSVIQRYKDKAQTPADLSADDVGDFANGKLLAIYEDYQQRLRTLNSCDFGDLILHALTIFKKQPEVLAQYQEKFQYILVDEYQDTNVAQYLWLRLLAQSHRNICCVGDDDQSIYSWRGAEVGNILRFEEDFPGAKTVRLEQNYRSTSNILGAASGLISHNSSRLGKTLWTDQEAPYDQKVQVRGLWDGQEEARFVGEEMESLQRKGFNLKEMAVLVRAGFQTREFEERLLKIGVPYKVIGGARFYERMEIRDAMAYLRMVAQPHDGMAFERIVNTPKRSFGNASLQILHNISREQGISMFDAAWQAVQSDVLGNKARNSLHNLLNDFARWQQIAQTTPHSELAQIVLDESGYTAMWQNDKSPESPGRLENLKELINAMEEFENLAGFLEHVSLVMDLAENETDDMVSLMTLHAAKGLEFDVVFLPGWEEGVFPNQRSMDESGNAALEEERRLAYVGITRAKKRLFISYAANRRIYNQWQSSVPSRFVDELPSDFTEVQAETGVYGSGPQFQNKFQKKNYDKGHAQVPRNRQSPKQSQSRFGGTMSKKFKSTGASSGAYSAPKKTITIQKKKDGIVVGNRVSHEKFGFGVVRSIDGNKVHVIFEGAGIKKVLKSFIKPA